MKTIQYQFDCDQTGIVEISARSSTGNNWQVYTNDYITLNVHKVGVYTTIQVLVPEGTSPDYNIEVNLGMVSDDYNYQAPTGQIVIDPDGWTNIPQSIVNPNQQGSVCFGFVIPFYGVRLRSNVAGSGIGKIKVLQQGIV